MQKKIPSIHTFMTLSWDEIRPLVDDLESRALTAETIEAWLHDWSELQSLFIEREARTRVKNLQDTTNEENEALYKAFLEEISPEIQKATQKLIEKLLIHCDAHGEPAGFEYPLRRMRVDAALFREANLPLKIAEQENAMQFNKVVGAQTVEWDGEEQTFTALASPYASADRATRRKIWDLYTARELADKPVIDALWTEVLALRMQQAANAGFPGDYRSYRWQVLKRFDYTPEDSKAFCRAIEQTAVPAAGRIYEKYAGIFGVNALAPWDLDLYQQTYPTNASEIRAFKDESELIERSLVIFRQVDPVIGVHFENMVDNGMIDFANRKGKGPGAFCTSFPASKTPFIFGNVIGLDSDVRTLLHEAGHAFHAFEAFRLPYDHQRRAPMEFNEVASTAMELLAAPYLGKANGGFFDEDVAVRSRIRHLEKILLAWPYIAAVVAFQHWVYENAALAADPKNCDAAWLEQWDRFIPFIDWTGVEEAKILGWHRKRHVHRSPFYYIEYGLASLGAVQIWENAMKDQAEAVRSYLSALALGGTAGLPDLYTAAGGKFAFDVETVGSAVAVVERELVASENALFKSLA